MRNEHNLEANCMGKNWTINAIHRNQIMLTLLLDMSGKGKKMENDVQKSNIFVRSKSGNWFRHKDHAYTYLLGCICGSSIEKHMHIQHSRIISTARTVCTFNFEFINMYWNALSTCVPCSFMWCLRAPRSPPILSLTGVSNYSTTYRWDSLNAECSTHNCNVMSENRRSFQSKIILKTVHICLSLTKSWERKTSNVHIHCVTY